MELPKNITQIGEANHRCKIYVEDYVISYMKQLNRLAGDKDMAVALYGVRKEENDVSYLFLYGACKLNFLQRETRHLSQAQMQEIDRAGKKYFGEYDFLGYRLLNGEMIEGFHVCEQGICRYISGFAQFYEKNDNMLAYMLDARDETEPEVVDQQKYEAVKRKQEERRTRYEEKEPPKEKYQKEKYQKAAPPDNSGSLRGMRVAVAAVFALLCIIGLTSMNGSGEMEELQVMARQVINDVMEPTEEAKVDTLVAEDKLAEAILQENEAAAVSVEQMPLEESVEIPVESTEILPEPETIAEPVPSAEPETIVEPVPSVEPEVVAEPTPSVEPEVIAEPEPVSYIIKEGDTLINISVQNYGSDARVSEICSLNQIENPDDIKVGQKILLP